MKITPLAAESMGVRSMAAFAETDQFQLIIDPGATLSSDRHNRPPHQLETWRLRQAHERIRLYAGSAKAVIITCFHEDHFLVDPEIYRDKILFIQNPNAKSALQSRTTAFRLLNHIKGFPKDIIYMDDRTYELGDIKVTFSKPVPSSREDAADLVIMCALRHKKQSFIYTSNIQGLLLKQQLDWLRAYPADLLYMDGPILHNLAQAYTNERIARFTQNMTDLIESTRINEMILDHHIARDETWRDKLKALFNRMHRHRIKIQTVAEYRGEINDYLESRRQSLYQNDIIQS